MTLGCCCVVTKFDLEEVVKFRVRHNIMTEFTKRNVSVITFRENEEVYAVVHKDKKIIAMESTTLKDIMTYSYSNDFIAVGVPLSNNQAPIDLSFELIEIIPEYCFHELDDSVLKAMQALGDMTL